jgi:hypothetical protein
MTKDTLKSLGYLGKSLKMSKRALANNKDKDGVTDQDFADINTAIDNLVKQVGIYEAIDILSASVTAPVPVTSIPTAVADDNLLTT